MPDDFNIPESNRIGSMMNELFGNDIPATRSNPVSGARRTPAPRKPAARRRARLGPVTLGQFASGANWANTAGYESPLIPPPEPKLGALTLGSFAAGVNWANTADAPKLLASQTSSGPRLPDAPVKAPQPTVDTLFNEFSWD